MRQLLAVVILLGVFALPGKASVTGSIGFVTPDLVLADASPTGNIETATMFILQGFSTTHNVTGIFAGLPIQNFGTVQLIPATPTGFGVSDHEFGMFSGDSITKVVSGNGFLNMLVQGDWIPGTFNGGLKCPGGCDAELRIAMTQTPPKTGEISLSGTMSITAAAVVPEPPTALLFLSGIGMVFAGAKLRRLWV